MKSVTKHQWLASTALVGAMAFSASAFALTGGSDPSNAYASSGSFGVTSGNGGFSCTVYRPTSGSGHPIVIWGNGTGASPGTYGSGLRHWATHGFVVSAANTSNAGTGTAMLSCINVGVNNGGDGSRVGASGHSQGGGGTIMAGRDSRVDATAPMQPYTLGLGHNSSSWDEQRGPMLLLTGGSDFIASPTLNAAPVYSAANVPVFWAERNGASHFEPTGDFGDYRGISTAWFRYLLRNDTTARNLFAGSCSMCNASGWTVRRKGTLP